MSLDISLEGPEVRPVEKYWANYTHNVTPMWKMAGVYGVLYKSEGMLAKHILPILKNGLFDIKANAKKYEKLNPENGWGSYETAVPWLEKLIAACEENPESSVRVSS